MNSRQPTEAELRARAWSHNRQALVCDVADRWVHGTVMRCTRYPDYWDYNVVRVEEDPRPMAMWELIEVADEALNGLAHRRIDFDVLEAGEAVRSDFEAAGWRTLRLLYMRHERAPEPGPDLAVEEVGYDDVDKLRLSWHHEDYPGQDPGNFHEQQRELALARGARVFAVADGGEPIAFAQLEYADAAAEISHVYVAARNRGAGLGTALTRASIDAAGPLDDLWISADDEDRAKHIYARLGFVPVWLSIEATRLPS